MACDSTIFRPIDSFIKYFGDIKPYHTKILEVVEQYVFREEINVAILETFNLEVAIENDPLCKGVGFGLNFDDDCGFDALECCDLFECLGGFGLIFDNSDLLVSLPVTNIDGPTGQVTVPGNHLYDTYLNVISIPNLQTIVVAGDQSAYFANHEMFWMVRKNSYTMLAANADTITIPGNRVAQLLAKINIEIQNAGANDGHYGVISATLSGGNTVATLNRTLPANTLGNILVQSNNKNNGVYQIDSYAVAGGNTTLTLTPDTPVRFINAQIPPGQYGAIQLRTGFVPNRKLWIEDDAVAANNGEWKIVQAWYDVTTSSTVVVFDGTLQDSAGGATTINLYGYETGAGYDGLNECTAPQPYNISAQFSEWLQITIEEAGPGV